MREARSKLRLIRPEDMDMDEYLVLPNPWRSSSQFLMSFHISFFAQDWLCYMKSAVN